MIFIKDGQPADSLILSPDDRGFQYGDGLFETMFFKDGSIPLARYHEHRLQRGMFALGLQTDYSAFAGYWIEKASQLIKENSLDHASYRVKYYAWRTEGGYYTPQDDRIHHMISVEPYEPAITERKIAISERAVVNYHPFSRFKTSNALTYIVAGREMRERQLDDIVLLNNNGHVAEGLFSNIFWIKDDTYYTPHIQTGCKEGVMRKHILKQLAKHHNRPEKVKATPEEVQEADHIFLTNALGIHHVRQWGVNSYRPYPHITELLPF